MLMMPDRLHAATSQNTHVGIKIKSFIAIKQYKIIHSIKGCIKGCTGYVKNIKNLQVALLKHT